MTAILFLILLIPFAGAAVAAVGPRTVAKPAAVLAMLATLALAAVLLVPHGEGFRLASLESIGFSVSFRADGISKLMVLLASGIGLLTVIASTEPLSSDPAGDASPNRYFGWLMALIGLMLASFTATDALLFYICFELTLVPTFFLLAEFGGNERRYAATKFFLFTFFGSIFTLGAILYLGLKFNTFNIAQLANLTVAGLSEWGRFWVILGLSIGFLVKTPVFPLHTWLPITYTQAPTPLTALLSAVMAKLGTYGLLRLVVLMTAGGALAGTPAALAMKIIAVLAIIGILYAALIAWAQTDSKRLIAYSSISHLGFCVLALMAAGELGRQGAVLYMINHGISTAAVFFMLAMLFRRFGTLELDAFSGLSRTMPIFSTFFVLFAMSLIGLPGTNGFVSEFLSILSTFKSATLGPIFGIVAALGVILGAVYMLQMVGRMIFGPVRGPEVAANTGLVRSGKDLTAGEFGLLLPLAILVLWLGVLPNGVLRMVTPVYRTPYGDVADVSNSIQPVGQAFLPAGESGR